MTPLPSDWLTRRVRVLVVGAGGNGSQMLSGLARLHVALRSLGSPGLSVTAYDPDLVSTANVGRQLFSESDIGQPKVRVLIQRINLFFGLDWDAHVEPAQCRSASDLVIGCVDTIAARRWIAKNRPAHFWLDLGNTARTGQVVLGHLNQWTIDSKTFRQGNRAHSPTCLPHVLELFPFAENAKDDASPSCSLADALGKQDLFINQAVATAALDLLWQWFRQGHITRHGAFINLETGNTRGLPICPATWQRLITANTPNAKRRPSKSNAPVKKKHKKRH